MSFPQEQPVRNVYDAIDALRYVNDHFNNGGVYDELTMAVMLGLFRWLQSQTAMPPPEPGRVAEQREY